MTFPVPDANAFGNKKAVLIDRLLVPYVLDVVDGLAKSYLYDGDSEDVTEMVLQLQNLIRDLMGEANLLADRIGEVKIWSGIVDPPANWLRFGQVYPAADYPLLCEVIDQSWIFNGDIYIPEINNRFIMGAFYDSGGQQGGQWFLDDIYRPDASYGEHGLAFVPFYIVADPV